MRYERDELCPHEPEGRAARCEGCVQSSGGLPACVAAWLERSVNVDLQLAERRERRAGSQRLGKAA